MVGFRNLVPALALAALSVGAASAAIDCKVSAPQMPIRAEGLTEKVGDILLTCDVDASVVNTTGTFQIKTDGPAITSRLTDAENGVSMVTLTSTTDPTNPTKGTVVNPTTIRFSNVKLDYAYTAGVNTQFTAVISGIRINATQANSDLSPVYVTVNGLSFGDENSGLTISKGSPVAVAAVAAGLKISVPADNEAHTVWGVAKNLTQCSNVAEPDNDSPLPALTVAADTTNAYVVFTPTFKGAFKGFSTDNAAITLNKLLAGEFPESPDNNHGTFLVAKFKNIPANAKLWVGNRNVVDNAQSATVIAVKDLKVKTVPTIPDFAWKEVTVASDGTATATWQVVNIPVAGTDAFNFPVRISYDDATVGLKTVQVSGNFAPISDKTAADEDSDVPRFVDAGLSYKNLITVNACSTTLLFPYVTAGGGWDTGIAISNTSADVKLVTGKYYVSGSDKDPAGSQSGTCSLYYSGTGAPTAPVTTAANVDAGATLAFTTTGGSAEKYGVPATPEFTGYVIAQCNFQNAHGFAFMSGPGAAGPAGVGYTALVLKRGNGETPEELGN